MSPMQIFLNIITSPPAGQGPLLTATLPAGAVILLIIAKNAIKNEKKLNFSSYLVDIIRFIIGLGFANNINGGKVKLTLERLRGPRLIFGWGLRLRFFMEDLGYSIFFDLGIAYFWNKFFLPHDFVILTQKTFLLVN